MHNYLWNLLLQAVAVTSNLDGFKEELDIPGRSINGS